MILTVLLVLIAASNLIMVAFLWRFRSQIIRIRDAWNSFITAPDAKTPSPLAQTVDTISQVVARAVIVQAKTSLMGMNSGAARAEKSEAAKAAMAAYPALGFLEKFAPGLSKTLAKNPQLLNLAAQYLKGKTGSNPSPGNGHQISVKEPLFKL